MRTVCWNRKTTPPELHSALATLSAAYPIRHGSSGGLQVVFKKTGKPGSCLVEVAGSSATISYGTEAMALRALGALMAGEPRGRKTMFENSSFTTFGIMLDCSRNAVMTVEHFKKWLRQLALLGYNMAMLYTEDTYELPGEYYFGHLRGRYTASELREIDRYAAALGIEMIPCIQTLGHLAQILQWPAYGQVKDTSSVMLVGEPKTYALIEKMVRHWSGVFKSRRIHIGMDETHDLGRGRYLDRYGFRRGFDIFNAHLDKVVQICKKHGLKPMIWSDMYFRLGSPNHSYYDPKCKIPKDVIAKIPRAAELVYWDYYHDDEGFYRDWIRRHRAMGYEPLMASGVWTWGKLWHDRKRTEDTALPCIAACRKESLKEIFFTMWGDDGGYCDFDSALAGLALCAEKAYADDFSEKLLAARFEAICGADYAAQNQAAGLEYAAGAHQMASFILWDDPLLAITLSGRRAKLKSLEKHYLGLAAKLKHCGRQTGGGDLSHARLIAETLAAKIGLARRLFEAYSGGSRARLKAVRLEIPGLVRLLEQCADSLRANWMARNKPFGLEVVQIRMGGVIARCRELDCRLGEYLSGRAEHIPELEANLKKVKWPGYRSVGSSYRSYATGSVIL
ncbi:MAG: family 20 glycosylhydrolase [Kiritimatiellia bacterium]